MERKKRIKNIFLSCGIFLVAVVLSLLFERLEVIEHITTIFVFAVFLISLLTDGYAYGIVSAVCGTLAVNYAFTFPYLTFNFDIPVDLISALIMTTVSVMTGMLTTKIKRYEAEKAKSERERMRANLLRAVSHDLRTPLTTIYSASSILRDKRDMLTEEQQDMMLKNIGEDAQWLVRMVENLLSITRISNEEIRIEKTPVILDELVDSVMTKLLKRYPNCRVDIDTPEEIVVLSVDPILIEQVLINLLENALLHAEGMTQLSLRAFVLGQKVVFEVADDGCGIAEDRLAELFTGVQASTANTQKRSAGIGLSVCATIIQAHEGEISAENRRGGGALFRFTLKKEDAADDEQ